MGFPLSEARFARAPDVLSTFVPIRDAETLYSHRAAGLFPSRRADYSTLTYARLAAAETVGLDEYLAASAERSRLSEAFAAVFDDVDLLLAPLATSTPPRIDGERPDENAWNALGLHMVLEDLLGVPSCAVRAGFDGDGLPVGVQLVGPAGADALVLSAAQAFFRRYSSGSEAPARTPRAAASMIKADPVPHPRRIRHAHDRRLPSIARCSSSREATRSPSLHSPRASQQ